MLDLDLTMGAIVDDPAACVVFERFIGLLWSCRNATRVSFLVRFTFTRERGEAVGKLPVAHTWPRIQYHLLYWCRPLQCRQRGYLGRAGGRESASLSLCGRGERPICWTQWQTIPC